LAESESQEFKAFLSSFSDEDKKSVVVLQRKVLELMEEKKKYQEQVTGYIH